jgi:hypothetical protein
MKILVFGFGIILMISCTRNNQGSQLLTATDLAAITGMSKEANNLKASSTQLSYASNHSAIKHWDSVYHHADSVYWHHHSQYNHANHHSHNDHHHQWVAYDHAIDHSKHYHPVYPGHPHDSLVTVSNGHHPVANTHHPDIHTITDHRLLDSLHRLHQRFHQ